MALKCGTYKSLKNECQPKNKNFEKLKYQNCKYGNVRNRDKDLSPLGGTYFVDILRKKDEKRVAKINYDSDLVKSHQRTKIKKSYLCSDFCGRRKFESGPLNDKFKDFKITQSK
jgi:hypothetical protein